jgi:hypothetical protein
MSSIYSILKQRSPGQTVWSGRHRISLMGLGTQAAWLFLLSIPVACVAWTVTHEEVFRESREYCKGQCQSSRNLFRRKFFYLFTCEYCFSHYVAALFLVLTGFKILYDDWRGYVMALFALVWMANLHMSVYNRLRLDIKHEGIEIKAKEEEVEEKVEERRAA